MESPSFLDHLKTSGLLSDELVAQVSGRFSNSAMQVVVADLVEEGLLTPFQVQQLHAGQPKGLVLGQYHLLDELGRGGYGCVYKARHKLMNRVVALKVIAPERVEDSRARAWFRREVLAATQLTHPNIALAYDADEIDGILFFAMEYIDGLNLDVLVRQRGPVPIGTACEMLLQTAKALQYAHEMGMVHRDIKPANLLIPRGTVAEAASDFVPQSFAGSARPVLIKVVDFGLARLRTSSSNNTLVLQNERSFVGTPAYVSPEQARNVHEVDIRSDLYSLGCTFYHALTGRPPFQADTPLQIVVQHLEKEPDLIERLRPEIPSALASILRRLMAKKPEKRFQTPSELLGELGFFYTLDRSGIQRSLPFAVVQPGRFLPSEPAIATPESEAEVSADQPANESHYEPTRMVAWDAPPAPAPNSSGQWASSESGVIPPPTAIQPSEVAAPATIYAHTAVIPKAPPTETPNDHTRAIDGSLAHLWQQWAGVIDALAAGRAPALNDLAYRVLHRDLLVACTAPKQTALFQRIAELAQPWLTLATLDGIDRDTMTSLQAQCHAITRQLDQAGTGQWRWAIGPLLLLMAACSCYFLVQIVGAFPPMRASAWMAWIQRNPLVSVSIFLPAVVITSMVLMKAVLGGLRRDKE